MKLFYSSMTCSRCLLIDSDFAWYKYCPAIHWQCPRPHDFTSFEKCCVSLNYSMLLHSKSYLGSGTLMTNLLDRVIPEPQAQSLNYPLTLSEKTGLWSWSCPHLGYYIEYYSFDFSSLDQSCFLESQIFTLKGLLNFKFLCLSCFFLSLWTLTGHLMLEYQSAKVAVT